MTSSPPFSKDPSLSKSPLSQTESGDLDPSLTLARTQRLSDENEIMEASQGAAQPRRTRVQRIKRFFTKQAMFVGPGLVASIAYIDPGNWATDLSAGSQYGYSHLFIVLISGLTAIFLQILASRLGIVSGKDLAQQCRASLHNRPRHTMWYRWGMLYPLYVLAEAAIIFTDLAELLGSAIAITLLVPAIPLWGGVLLTGLDIFLVLIMFNNYPSKSTSRSLRFFEIGIGILVLVVLACFAILLHKVQPDWGEAFRDYLPNGGIFSSGGIYISVGIIGATVMPHALFLGSKLATIDRVSAQDDLDDTEAKVEINESTPLPITSGAVPSSATSHARSRSRSFGPSLHFPQPRQMPHLPLASASTPAPPQTDGAEGALVPENTSTAGDQWLKHTPTAKFIHSYLKHASLDIAFSLVCFALVINSAILIVAAAAFRGAEGDITDGDLFAAHALLKAQVGSAPATLFALALLLSGQCASITVTLAGQIVSEGFLNWSIPPWIRRLVTRSIGMIPSMAVALAVGKPGLNTLLVASQAALSIVLPFVVLPLLIFTSSQYIMSIRTQATPSYVLDASSSPAPIPAETASTSAIQKAWQGVKAPFALLARRRQRTGWASFANSHWMVWLGGFIMLCLTAANGFAIVELIMGNA